MLLFLSCDFFKRRGGQGGVSGGSLPCSGSMVCLVAACLSNTAWGAWWQPVPLRQLGWQGESDSGMAGHLARIDADCGAWVCPRWARMPAG
eukprot:1157834-Pelagomonas_calceolata.AAC.5